MEFILIGLATAFNILIIKTKLERNRYEDAIMDTVILIILSSVFGGSYGGLVVATIASALISLIFLVSPPTFFSRKKGSSFLDKLKEKARRP